MLALKMLLTVAGVLLLAAAFGFRCMHFGCAFKMRGAKRTGEECSRTNLKQIAWRGPFAPGAGGLLAAAGCASIVVVPSGMGGVRISQIERHAAGHAVSRRALRHAAGRQRGDLRPARSHVHRGHGGPKARRAQCQKTALDVQSREGLNIGLGVTVRYRLDPNKLASVQAHLPQPADKELVPPVVASAWRELAPQYTVREIFSTKREEVRAKAASIITRKLGTDGIVVEEVMLSDVQLPEEYAKGLEGCC